MTERRPTGHSPAVRCLHSGRGFFFSARFGASVNKAREITTEMTAEAKWKAFSLKWLRDGRENMYFRRWERFSGARPSAAPRPINRVHSEIGSLPAERRPQCNSPMKRRCCRAEFANHSQVSVFAEIYCIIKCFCSRRRSSRFDCCVPRFSVTVNAFACSSAVSGNDRAKQYVRSDVLAMTRILIWFDFRALQLMER